MPDAEKQQESKSRQKTQKFNLESWLVIANIVITAIIGIYLAFRNEGLQRQLIELQSKSELANIRITDNDYEGKDKNVSLSFGPLDAEPFSITNSGPAIAKNIQVGICISRTGILWDNARNDISNYDFQTSNPSIEYEIKYDKINCSPGHSLFDLPNYFNSNLNNAVSITIDHLPPNQTIYFYIPFKEGKALINLETERKMHLIVPSYLLSENSQNMIDPQIESALMNYFDPLFDIAGFKLALSCDNCVVERNRGYSNSSTPYNLFLKDVQIITQNDDYTQISAIAQLTYHYLDNSTNVNPSINNPIYFQSKVTSDGNFSGFSEVDKTNFDALASQYAK